jgi:threonine dehydrogenase-like Zn-dependent dehydrogenase
VGLILMLVIVAGTGLIALYANVQKARRATIEKVTITPISSTPTASAPQP